jgi:hypothetical protein
MVAWILSHPESATYAVRHENWPGDFYTGGLDSERRHVGLPAVDVDGAVVYAVTRRELVYVYHGSMSHLAPADHPTIRFKDGENQYAEMINPILCGMLLSTTNYEDVLRHA